MLAAAGLAALRKSRYGGVGFTRIPKPYKLVGSDPLNCRV